MGASGSTINVGVPGRPGLEAAQKTQLMGVGVSHDALHAGNEEAGGVTSQASQGDAPMNQLASTATSVVSASAAPPVLRQQDLGLEGWVDATVITPLFPNGRPPGVDREARHQKKVSKFRVFSDGVVFEGPEASTDGNDLCRGWERLTGRPVTRVTVWEKRAQQVLLACAGGRFWAVPSRQSFSRHAGVCLVLGDKTARGPKHSLKVGDILRLGSVGVLISEVHTGTTSQTVPHEVLEQIREEVLTAPQQVFALTRTDLYDLKLRGNTSGGTGTGDSNAAAGPQLRLTSVASQSPLHRGADSCSNEETEDEDEDEYQHTSPCLSTQDDESTKPQCYICMDSQEAADDVLVAPCDCKGSTGLVHVKCLQRLVNAADTQRAARVLSTRHESHTCRICKAAYKTHVRLPNGTVLPLLGPALSPPYIALVVVTRHESHPELFNTIFQLSFARASELSLGRSQACDVVIPYRTVSTRHATITMTRNSSGQVDFWYQDSRSSNGSLLYLRGPLEIPTSRVMRLRMGRSVLSLRARRSLQISTFPRRTAADALRWVSSLGRTTHGGRASDDTTTRWAHAGGGGGGDGGGGGNNAGGGGGRDDGGALDVLRRLYDGKVGGQGSSAHDDNSLGVGGESSGAVVPPEHLYTRTEDVEVDGVGSEEEGDAHARPESPNEDQMEHQQGSVMPLPTPPPPQARRSPLSEEGLPVGGRWGGPSLLRQGSSSNSSNHGDHTPTHNARPRQQHPLRHERSSTDDEADASTSNHTRNTQDRELDRTASSSGYTASTSTHTRTHTATSLQTTSRDMDEEGEEEVKDSSGSERGWMEGRLTS